MSSNGIFKNLAIKAYQLDMEELPNEEELKDIHVFSESFKDNIKKLDNYAKYKYFFIKGKMIRRTTAIAISFLLIMTISLSVESIGTPIINFLVVTYEKYSSIIYKRNADDLLPMTIEEKYIASYIPEDYKLI